MHREGEAERRRVAELDLQQSEYDASLAERRYAACDPENRLIAAQLEKHWEAALRRVEACRARLAATDTLDPTAPMPDFEGLAADLSAAWSAQGVTTRSRQQLIRALISDIIADVDDATREVVLTIHWQGGQHSQLRVRKPRTGEHGCRDGKHGDALFRRRYRGNLEPDGRADRPGQDLDGAPGGLYPQGPQDPRLSLGREGRSMAHNARGRGKTRGDQPCRAADDPGRDPACRAGRSGRAMANPGR